VAHAERVERKNWMNRQDIRSVWIAPRTEHAFQTLLWRAHHTPKLVDCLLAAESITRGWPLVTRNVKDFVDIPGMLVVGY
jgi:predicted nucleic acid-binding protein